MKTKNISRRDFIKISAGALLSANLLRSSNIFAEETNDLAVAKSENTEEAVKKAFEALGGVQKFVKPKQTVILKPNISFPNPASWATTTNPQVVAAVASLCIDAGAKRVLVIDHPMRQPEKSLSRTGIEAACKNINGVYVRMESKQRDYKEILLDKAAGRLDKAFNLGPGALLKKVEISKKAQSKGVVLINLPVAKSHSATGVSFGMKNLMGLIWDRTYFHQVDIHRAIAELTAVIRPDLTIVDATQVLLTRGPEGPGQTKELNTIIAGTDPVAVDAYATTLERWNGQKLAPKDVGYIVAAHELGLGEIDLNKVNIREV